MGTFYRCVYIPMPKLTGAPQLGRMIARAGVRYGSMEGVEEEQGWDLYLPRQKEIASAGRSLITRFARKPGGVRREILWHKPGTTPLDSIRAALGHPTVLYVHCHGNSEVIGFRPLSLSPAQLAARLRDDGLAVDGNPLRIKLWSCHSAETAPDGGKSYLERFAAELRRIGYYNVDLYGYGGPVRVNGTRVRSHKQVQIGGEWERAKEHRTHWNSGDAPSADLVLDGDDDDAVEGIVFVG